LRLLRQSIARERGTKVPPAKKGRKRIEGQGEMLLPIAGKKGKETATKPAAKPASRQKKAG
jgi:DNA end-binding protein Ku